MKADVINLDASAVGSIELSDEVFALEPRTDILQRMVRYQLSKRQAGTHKAKQRGEVNGPNKKIYKQKGTGQARHGNDKPPQFRGGGRAFGPVPRSHAHDLPKKVRALALKHALSVKAKSQAIVVLDKAELSEPKTAHLRGKLDGLGLVNALVVDGATLQDHFALAARNIPNVDVLPVQGINVYDILRRDKLVLTRAAVEALEERFK
jgi:large subunit ribosomal protein L4